MHLHTLNSRRSFELHTREAADNLIPFIEQAICLPEGSRVLEIGCGEGGVLKAFISKRHRAVGVELDREKVFAGCRLMQREVVEGSMRFIAENISNISDTLFDGRFHLIILNADSRSHSDGAALLYRLRRLLQPNGAVLFRFSPWQTGLDNHTLEQHSRLARTVPFLYAMPAPIRSFICSTLPAEGRSSTLTIERFQSILRRSDYTLIRRQLFLSSPSGSGGATSKKRLLPSPLQYLPVVRNLVTSTAYYLVRPRKEECFYSLS